MAEPRNTPPGHDVPNILLVAAWTGLLTGLLEGAGWLILQRAGRLTQVWTEVLWITPALDLLLFLGLGLGLAALSSVVPRRWWWPTALFLVGCGASWNVVSLYLGPIVSRVALVVLALGLATTFMRAFRHFEAAALPFVRRTLPYLGGIAVALFLGVQGMNVLRERAQVNSLPVAEADAPDVLVVILDALRADHMSAYGYPRRTSPFLDALAGEGVLFERALSASSYSLPSHASMLSGLHPHEHGVEWLEFKVFEDAEYPSIAEAMRDRGYRTGAFSANPFWFTRVQGFGRGFIRFEDFYHSAADMAYRTVFGNNLTTIQLALGFDHVPGRKLGTESTDRVLDWVLRDDDKPFFAFVNYFDVHAPYTPPQPYRGQFSDQEAPGGILNWLMDRRGDLQLTPEERQSEIDGYDGSIAYVDAELRRLVEEIDSARGDRDLLVIVTSDHGEAFGEHGGYLHARSLYREELHIPLIIHGPDVPAGLRIDRPVTHTSLPATILDLVSNGTAPTFGSPSLVALWSDPDAAATWPYPLSEAGERDWAHPSFPMHHGDMRSLVSPEWHLIESEALPTELYSWDDARQTRNRAQDPDVRAVLKGLSALFPAWDAPAP
jgi:arylsulfatase A-like enzyme